jgi:tetratricopeptide (TPR) repeat protein
MSNLAAAYQVAGKFDLALPLLEETLKLKTAKLGADHPDTLTSMNNLAAYYRVAGRPDLALPLYQEPAAGLEKLRFQHEYAGRIVPVLIAYHEQLGQLGWAEAWRRKWLAVVKERIGADSPPYAGELAALGLNLLRQKKWADAEPVLREALAIREKKDPDGWTTFNTRSMLGGALLGQKKYAEAEPLLLTGYEGMKQREKTISPQGKARLAEALDRLIELSAATDKPAETAKWLAEWAKHAEPVPPPRETP